MTTTTAAYTTQLQAGLGMIDETRVLLDLWQEGTDAPALCRAALTVPVWNLEAIGRSAMLPRSAGARSLTRLRGR